MTATSKLIFDNKHFGITIERLCYQLIENHDDFSSSVIIGIQPRGINLSRRIHQRLSVILQTDILKHGELDITFFRDDFRRRVTVLLNMRAPLLLSLSAQK